MAKSVHNDVLDASLSYVADNADLYTICSVAPTTFAEASSTYKLVDLAIDSGDFTGPADGDISGRKLTVNAQTNIGVDSTGVGTHYALCDSGNSKLLYVTEVGTYHTDTAAAGGASTITLGSGASAVDDTYNGYGIRIVSGTGAGEDNLISDYVGSTKVATVSAWGVQPDNTSVYEVYGKRVESGNLANTAAWDVELRDPA